MQHHKSVLAFAFETDSGHKYKYEYMSFSPVQVQVHVLESIQEAQLSPSDRAMRLVSSNLANYQATVQKLLIQVLTKPMV